eukprot:6189170-Pleurochrysis_carterae.AAC.2
MAPTMSEKAWTYLHPPRFESQQPSPMRTCAPMSGRGTESHAATPVAKRRAKPSKVAAEFEPLAIRSALGSAGELRGQTFEELVSRAEQELRERTPPRRPADVLPFKRHCEERFRLVGPVRLRKAVSKA